MAAARASAERYERNTGREVSTRIERLERFYLAEDYHQKYGLRGDRQLMGQFDAMYPDAAEFVNSTAAARVNGYLAGHGSAEMVASEIDRLGLTEQGGERVEERAGTSGAACAVPTL